jgi:hypothetical protein
VESLTFFRFGMGFIFDGVLRCQRTDDGMGREDELDDDRTAETGKADGRGKRRTPKRRSELSYREEQKNKRTNERARR